MIDCGPTSLCSPKVMRTIFAFISDLTSFDRHGINCFCPGTFVRRGRKSINSSAASVSRAHPAAKETCHLRTRLLARQTGVAFVFLRLRKHFLEQKLNPRQYLTFRIVRLQEIQTLRGRRETTELV